MSDPASAISRRALLQGGAALGAAAVLAACSGGDPRAKGGTASTTTSAAAGTHGGSTPGTLVVVTLYGGNDALNTVVPISDPHYASLRGDLALDPGAVHALDKDFALHPSLAQTAALWGSQQLAVVHGVGFDDLDRSHFHCMDEWQAAGDDHTTGWLGRWLDRTSDDPLSAVVIGRQLPLLGRGAKHSAAVVPDGPFTLRDEEQLRPLLTTMSGGSRPSPASLVAQSTADLLAVIDRVGPVLESGPGTSGDDDADTLGSRLATVASMIEADLPTRAYAVDLSSFDTHASQLDTHATLLTELDGALADFVKRMADRPVTLLVYSEFGRRVVPNASAGTDHGQAGTVLLAGHVKAGHHGDPPPLDDLADGDLRKTTDFRAVYGGVLEGVLGIDAADVIADAPKPLDLV